MLRSKISDLKNRNLIDGSVLTYHYTYPLRAYTDSLYLCLNVLSMSEPKTRGIQLSEESVKEIPKEIMNVVKSAEQVFDNPFLDRVNIIDYEIELKRNNAPSKYDGAPIDEIIRFASKGTEIALEILGDDKTKYQEWIDDNEIAEHIKELIDKRLTTPRERGHALHFVCNPLDMCGAESYLRTIWSKPTEPNSKLFLNELYERNEISQSKNSK
jgi:hypothetical protein